MKNLLLAAVVVVVVAGGARAQNPTKKSPAPTTQAAPAQTLELNPQEKEFLKLLSQKISPVQQGLQEAWQKLLTTEDEKEALNLWLKARLLNIKSNDIQKEFMEWFEKIKAIHKCPECNLQGDKLVRPEPSKASPTTP